MSVKKTRTDRATMESTEDIQRHVDRLFRIQHKRAELNKKIHQNKEKLTALKQGGNRLMQTLQSSNIHSVIIEDKKVLRIKSNKTRLGDLHPEPVAQCLKGFFRQKPNDLEASSLVQSTISTMKARKKRKDAQRRKALRDAKRQRISEEDTGHDERKESPS